MIVSEYCDTLTLALIFIVLDNHFFPLVAFYTFKGKLLLNKNINVFSQVFNLAILQTKTKLFGYVLWLIKEGTQATALLSMERAVESSIIYILSASKFN